MRHTRTAIALSVCALACMATAQAQKKVKDQGEHDIYTEVGKDFAANNLTKALADLDTWKQKYPASDFDSDRQLLYVQAYAAAKQPGKAVDAAAPLLAKDLDTALGSPKNVVALLFTTSVAIQQTPDATADQLATGGKAAQMLFDYGKKPEGLTDAAWTQARGQLQSAARGALIHVMLYPGAQAMKAKDCAGAEAAFTKAIEAHPDSAQAAYSLGTAQLCLYRTQPEKGSAALYSFARAAALDPVKGMADPKWQTETVLPYLTNLYNRFHGVDPAGLEQLKQVAVTSPLPPAGFTVKSLTQIAQEKQAEFEKTNPQLALWMKVKGALADTNGEQYFATSLKGAAVPRLRGVLVEAKPACRPKELLVAVPLPDAKRPLQAEISLKLDKALAGKPAADTEFLFEAVPAAFAPSPFLLTMDAESAKLDGLKTSPCTAAPAKKAVVRRRKR
jgi:hypothetical protein